MTDPKPKKLTIKQKQFAKAYSEGQYNVLRLLLNRLTGKYADS